MEIIKTNEAPTAIGPYVQGKIVGALAFCSGQIALDPESGERVGKSIEEQTKQVLKNVSALLQAAHSDFDHAIKTTCFLADINDFARFNSVYAEVFGSEFPARSAVGVAALPKGALLEIEVIAEVLETE